MARSVRKPKVNEFPVSEVKDGSSRFRLENDPRFLARVEAARTSLRAGRGVRLEDL